MSEIHHRSSGTPLPTIIGAALAGAMVVGWVLVGPGLGSYDGDAVAASDTKPAESAVTAQDPLYRLRASELLGKDVINNQGETVGSVEDLIITRDDRVTYAIISVGGFLGLGDKLVAVDYEELRHGAKGTVLLNASKGQLESQPAFVFADDKASYEQRVAQRIDSWKSKVSSFTEEAKQEGQEARRATADKLESAWQNVQQEWDKLKDASGDAWQATKARFENAWQDLERAWQDATTETDDT